MNPRVILETDSYLYIRVPTGVFHWCKRSGKLLQNYGPNWSLLVPAEEERDKMIKLATAYQRLIQ